MANRSRAQMGRKKYAETAAAESTGGRTVDATTAAASSLTFAVTDAQRRAKDVRDRLPDSARLALSILLTLLLSSLSQWVLRQSTQNELESITRQSDSKIEHMLSAGWKMYVIQFLLILPFHLLSLVSFVARWCRSRPCSLVRPVFTLRPACLAGLGLKRKGPFSSAN